MSFPRETMLVQPLRSISNLPSNSEFMCVKTEMSVEGLEACAFFPRLVLCCLSCRITCRIQLIEKKYIWKMWVSSNYLVLTYMASRFGISAGKCWAKHFYGLCGSHYDHHVQMHQVLVHLQDAVEEAGKIKRRINELQKVEEVRVQVHGR